MSENEYWFCLTHHTVEGRDGCKNADRLGPYASSAEASRALEKVEERNEEWDNDPKWNDDGPGSGDGLTDGNLLTLLAHDPDPFNRWEAAQRLALSRLLGALASQQSPQLDDAFAGALRRVLRDPALDAAFKEVLLTLPSESNVAERLRTRFGTAASIAATPVARGFATVIRLPLVIHE